MSVLVMRGIIQMHSVSVCWRRGGKMAEGVVTGVIDDA